MLSARQIFCKVCNAGSSWRLATSVDLPGTLTESRSVVVGSGSAGAVAALSASAADAANDDDASSVEDFIRLMVFFGASVRGGLSLLLLRPVVLAVLKILFSL